MVFRNEVKHPLSPGDKASLCAALRSIARPDPHAGPSGQYTVRSLYFDDLKDRALREKLDGVSRREKFRIRYYDDDLTFIRLEKKVKQGDRGCKLSCSITREETARILEGDTGWMPSSGRALIVELYGKMKSQGLRPRTIVACTRTPFVYGPGHVRVTIDEHIRSKGRRASAFSKYAACRVYG